MASLRKDSGDSSLPMTARCSGDCGDDGDGEGEEIGIDGGENSTSADRRAFLCSSSSTAVLVFVARVGVGGGVAANSSPPPCSGGDTSPISGRGRRFRFRKLPRIRIETSYSSIKERVVVVTDRTPTPPPNAGMLSFTSLAVRDRIFRSIEAYVYVEEVDVKADGEGIALASSYPVDADGDVDGDRFGDENDGFEGGTGVK